MRGLQDRVQRDSFLGAMLVICTIIFVYLLQRNIKLFRMDKWARCFFIPNCLGAPCERPRCSLHRELPFLQFSSLTRSQIWMKELTSVAAPRWEHSSSLAPLCCCIFFQGGGLATHRCLIG